jgi:hypothetical protein
MTNVWLVREHNDHEASTVVSIHATRNGAVDAALAHVDAITDYASGTRSRDAWVMGTDVGTQAWSARHEPMRVTVDVWPFPLLG